MINTAQNKMVNPEMDSNLISVSEKEVGIEEAYFFPDYGVTVNASSVAEANAKVQEIIKAK